MKNKGFTLIELLVVVAIIGFLSSIILVSLSNARGKSNTARRKVDMKQIETALGLYHNENGSYPSSGGSWRGMTAAYGSYGTTGSTGYIPNIAPTHIPTLPIDPLGPTACDGYLYFSNGTDYKLLSHNCPNTYPPAGTVFYDPLRPTWALKLCSKEPACSSW